jgi:hypothetical protein
LNYGLVDSFTFNWQRGYAVFSLGGKQLNQAVGYVRNQKAHHSQGTTVASLEQDTYEDNPPVPWKRDPTPE